MGRWAGGDEQFSHEVDEQGRQDLSSGFFVRGLLFGAKGGIKGLKNQTFELSYPFMEVFPLAASAYQSVQSFCHLQRRSILFLCRTCRRFGPTR